MILSSDMQKQFGMLMCKWSGLNKSYQSILPLLVLFSLMNRIYFQIKNEGQLLVFAEYLMKWKEEKSKFHTDCWKFLLYLAYYFVFLSLMELCFFKSIKSYPKSNFGLKTREAHLFFWDQNSKVISTPGMYETNVMACLCMRNHLLFQNLKIPTELWLT